MSLRVAVVDDQVLVRGGFAMVLGHFCLSACFRVTPYVVVRS